MWPFVRVDFFLFSFVFRFYRARTKRQTWPIAKTALYRLREGGGKREGGGREGGRGVALSQCEAEIVRGFGG